MKLAWTVQEHIGQERDVVAELQRDMVAELQEVRRRLEALEQVSLAGIAATLDGLVVSLDSHYSKLAARLERLDERLDDQYDRVRAIESTLSGR